MNHCTDVWSKVKLIFIQIIWVTRYQVLCRNQATQIQADQANLFNTQIKHCNVQQLQGASSKRKHSSSLMWCNIGGHCFSEAYELKYPGPTTPRSKMSSLKRALMTSFQHSKEMRHTAPDEETTWRKKEKAKQAINTFVKKKKRIHSKILKL